MIQIELLEPCWVKGSQDDPNDYCAHGKVLFTIDGLVISDGSNEWTVSGAALFLLRTVFHSHSNSNPVSESNLLIPCCGFTPYKDSGERFNLLLMGCNWGIDPQVTHRDKEIVVEYNEDKRIVSVQEWASAIVNFTEQVLAFYDSCSPKTEATDKYDKEGWCEFWEELLRNRDRARQIAEST